MSRKRAAPAAEAEVKVTIIETRFVEMDSANFKSIVQRLTGKGSAVIAETAPERSCATRRRAVLQVEEEEEGIRCGQKAAWLEEVMKEALFKEFEESAAMEPWLEEPCGLWD